MKIHGVAIENLKVIPEAKMIECAGTFGPDEPNKFKQCLEDAMVFRSVGLTPIYLCTSSLKKMFVTTKEKLRREYN